ncbi:hypothetical protein [Mesorhizobium sp. M1348]|uniref:hypothetical protein n=1 Tax=Mesorhizobium sp. M1348 TaxID=2957089 RepID=UPI003337712E
MGLDYIRAQTGKPWKKRWNGGLNRLKLPTLLDLTMSEAARTVTVVLHPGASLRAGDTLIVESGPTGVTVSDGLRPIGRVSNPSADPPPSVRAVDTQEGRRSASACSEIRRRSVFDERACAKRAVSPLPAAAAALGR